MGLELKIEPGDAVDHGLPPARITADLTGIPMLPFEYPAPDTYVTFSGPPGGPLFFYILALPRRIATPAALLKFVAERFGETPAFTLGAAAPLQIGGTSYPAQLFFSGSSNAASVSCAVAISAPAEHASVPGLLLVFGHGGSSHTTPPQTPESVAKFEPLSLLLARLKWDLCIDPNNRKRSSPTQGYKLVSDFTAAHEELEAAGVNDPAHRANTNVRASESGPAAAATPQAAKPAQLSRWVGNLSAALRSSGMWLDNAPPANAYGTMTPLQQQLWTLQAALQALEPALQQAQKNQPDEPLFGIVETVRAFSSIVPEDAELAQLRKLIDRGP